MRRIRIPAELERRLRQKWNPLDPEEAFDVCGEIVKLLDEEAERAAALKTRTGEMAGLGYKELVALFRFHLGDALITPPRPSPQYVVRLINRAREMGIHTSNVEQALKGARRTLRGKQYRLADLVYGYDAHFAAGQGDDNGDADSRNANVHTGRFDGNDGDGDD